MEIGNFIIFAILLMAVAIIVYSLFFAQKDKGVPKKKPLTTTNTSKRFKDGSDSRSRTSR